jgi:hypothetical protein
VLDNQNQIILEANKHRARSSPWPCFVLTGTQIEGSGKNDSEHRELPVCGIQVP